MFATKLLIQEISLNFARLNENLIMITQCSASSNLKLIPGYNYAKAELIQYSESNSGRNLFQFFQNMGIVLFIDIRNKITHQVVGR